MPKLQIVNHDNQIKEILKKADLKVTQPRISVIETLLDSDRPLNSKEIFDQITKKQKNSTEKSKIDQVTVYRIIESFKEKKIIHQILDQGYLFCRHISCNHKNHIMMVCSNCSKSLETQIDEELISKLIVHISKKNKFKVDQHSFQISGICQECDN